MSKKLFANSVLPVWAFVVVVVAGVLCILVSLGFIIRHFVVRRRAARLPSPDTCPPTRMMTVRRGRVVPQSHYLSLTGSRFGINELDTDVATTRSKSPFEWWNRVNRRNGSDDLSFRGSAFFAGSISTNMSTTTMAAAVAAAAAASEKAAEAEWSQKIDMVMPAPALYHPLPRKGAVAAAATPSPSSSPSNSPVRTTFLQRPLRTNTPISPFVFDQRLSKIEEASPHQSLIHPKSRHPSAEVTLAGATRKSETYCERRGAAELNAYLSQPNEQSSPPSPSPSSPPPPSSPRDFYISKSCPYSGNSSSSHHSNHSSNSQISIEKPAAAGSVSANTNSWHNVSQLNALPSVDEPQASQLKPPPRSSPSPLPQQKKQKQQAQQQQPYSFFEWPSAVSSTSLSVSPLPPDSSSAPVSPRPLEQQLQQQQQAPYQQNPQQQRTQQQYQDERQHQHRNSAHLSTISQSASDTRSSFPTRTTSKKGKVLRKKSLRNMEIVSNTSKME